ncbi:MAG TPA: ComEC/Rec2 family competence protein, partial [Armatimonadota bacterium]|nr:ComEC/Rec2 family competence protein [Armatimonadota bacterium]
AYECHQLHQTAPSPPLSAVRAQCFTALSRCMPGVYSSLNAQLLTSLVLGVYGTPLPDQLVEQFRQAGIIHLMVVSGSQIALFGGLFLIPFVFIPFGRARTSYPRTRLILLLISLPLLLIYVAIADRGPSVDRALFMVMLAALALCCALSPLGARRSFHPDGITLLAAAALVMLIGNPAIMFNPGMQLSFAAVFGLWSITPVLLRCWHRWPRWIALTLSATLGAQLMTYPVLAWHFGTIPLLAPLTNVFAVPIVGLLLPLGILALLLSMVAPPLAIAVNWLNLPLLRMLLFVSTLGGTNNWGQLLCYVRSPFAIVLYYMALGMSTLMLSHWLDSRVQGWDVPAGREPRMW